MKTLLATCLVAVPAAAAWAGPDWTAIDHARRARAGAQHVAAADAPPAAAVACPPAPPVLHPDHGPRPQVSPAHNRALRQRHEDALQRCLLAAR